MPTSSIIHAVHIKQKEPAEKFADALEHARGEKIIDVIISKTVNNLTVEQIRDLFGE